MGDVVDVSASHVAALAPGLESASPRPPQDPSPGIINHITTIQYHCHHGLRTLLSVLFIICLAVCDINDASNTHSHACRFPAFSPNPNSSPFCQCPQIQTKGKGSASFSKEEENKDYLRYPRPEGCHSILLGGRHAVCILCSPSDIPITDPLSSYLRAVEVGRSPTSAKYDLHIRLKTPRNGAVVRNRLRLPHPVKTDLRICVIAPVDSPQGKAALQAGASLVGEEEVFALVKEGKIEFERCICHVDSLQNLAKAGIARTLGPRGLMPSAKLGTVVKDVAESVRNMVGGSEYRERLGVVRMAIGQLAFTPEEVQRNIKAFMENVKKDINVLSDRINKDIHEVVLSSTNGPGMSLNGEMRGPDSISTEELMA